MRNLFGSLLLTLSLVAGFAHALAAEPVAGTNYEVLKVAHPTSAPPGKVEVISFFSYVIPQCYKLEHPRGFRQERGRPHRVRARAGRIPG
jgi:protein dithiol oxidoreductase (disulfide-forming)